MFVYGSDLFYLMISSSLRVFSPFLPLSLSLTPPQFTPPTVFVPSITSRVVPVLYMEWNGYTCVYLQPQEGTRKIGREKIGAERGGGEERVCLCT